MVTIVFRFFNRFKRRTFIGTIEIRHIDTSIWVDSAVVFD